MTRYGWDASHYDWDRGPMNVAAARSAGIAMMTHKVGEGYGVKEYHDPRFDDWATRAKPVGFPVAGSYYVNHPGDQATQAALWVADVDKKAPWWLDHPCWVWQIDAEWFQNMPRQPNVGEINTLGDEIMDRTGCHPGQVLVYAPEWLYGDTLRGLRYRQLWASAYGGNPVAGFKAAYPGDGSARLWDPYSGITPQIAQYGSRLTIGTQPSCDANAIRVTSDAALQALFTNPLGEDMALDAETKAYFEDRFDDLQQRLNVTRLGKIDKTAYQMGEQVVPTLVAIRAAVGALDSGSSPADVAALASALAADLGPELGAEFVAALKAAL